MKSSITITKYKPLAYLIVVILTLSAVHIGAQNVYVLQPAGPEVFDPLCYSPGLGSFTGKTCFDIALGNNGTNFCGPLSSRASQQANFTLPATHTQSYTFTPTGTVSNVRFLYVNTNGSVITAISGNNTGNNISTPVVATVNYNTSLNTLAAGLTNNNPLTAQIIVLYNDGPTNGGTDRQLSTIVKVKDCACCGAYISPTEWKEFLCHNLGADISLDPHIPVKGIHGAQIQWGKRGPNTTGDSRVDWQTAANNGAGGFARNPISTHNQAAISGWSATAAANGAWSVVKTANDPCPTGYRVPSTGEWTGVNAYNTKSATGLPWTESISEYGNAVHFGPNLTLPVAGYRYQGDGELLRRGDIAEYWSCTEETATTAQALYMYDAGVATPQLLVAPDHTNVRLRGFSIRCIAQ